MENFHTIFLNEVCLFLLRYTFVQKIKQVTDMRGPHLTFFTITLIFVIFTGFEVVTTSHLFQAASLAVQQATRGCPFSEALLSACSDVYVGSRQLTSDQRERCGQLLCEFFKISIYDLCNQPINAKDVVERDCLDTSVVTLGTLSLQENSASAHLQQKCAMLSTALKLLTESKMCTLRDLFKDDLKNDVSTLFDKNFRDIVPQILLTLISSVSKNDLCLRRKMVLSTIASCDNIKVREKLLDLEKYLTSVVQQAIDKDRLSKIEGVLRKDLCWDLRRVSQWMVDCQNFDHENKIIALLYYLKQVGVKVEEMKNNSVQNMSALEFSMANCEGNLLKLIL